MCERGGGLSSIKTKRNNQNMCCSICLSSFESSSSGVTQLECKHSFHSSCLEKWMKVSNTCPLCRRESDTYIMYYINIKINKKYNSKSIESHNVGPLVITNI